ncbi:hypothetical protein M408DRAFT_166554 [Serendipita vermifera MAFF 305830]|uniref:Uncharacterized protein n=1 Tax=Serendipita vermifera MAFF 305830 TaxID=933852 RepID=A0A0C2XEK2_SERVB|nr:hypothetical protein M408DRAFT_166554 [Serendipita vermifera MAFF 305830]
MMKITEKKTINEKESPLNRRSSHVGSHSTELPYLLHEADPTDGVTSGPTRGSKKKEIHQVPRDVSPTSASVTSIPQSFSGTSDASQARLSFSSSLREMVAPLSTLPDSEPARASSEYTPSFLAPPSPLSNVPFVTTTQDDGRNMTPSPPPSFRSLYAAGRLPPSSRGPGPHMPSGKIPLLQRAVTLMSRSLPPIPREELPPRRSSSAFHAIRSRTSSKAKREQAKAAAQATASERASSSSDITVTGDLPPKLELHEPRQRTKSSPLVMSSSSSSRSVPPPVPALPPIVVSDDHSNAPPIARMFMERRVDASKSDTSHGQPPTAYRSTSPTPSMSSAQASLSSCAGHPSRLFTPSFDEGIFDAFPEVPGHLPSSSVVARHSKLMAAEAGGRGALGRLPNRSFSELEDHMTGSYSGRAEAVKSQHGPDDSSKATVKSNDGMSPIRRKAPSRKLIPGWYDDDDDDGENETGWASVQVIRSRLM